MNTLTARKATLLLLLASIAGGLRLLQGTSHAPLPHAVDGFLLGFSVALFAGLSLWGVYLLARRAA